MPEFDVAMDDDLPDRANSQQKKDDHVPRAHGTNDLPHDPSIYDPIYDSSQWVNKQSNIAESLKYLKQDLIIADLHTHLMGMGDHSFWIDQIMRNELFTMKNRPLESLEWYGPLCYSKLPNLEIVLKNTEEGSYSTRYNNNHVEMKRRIDGYHCKLNPTADPFTFSVTREDQGKKTTKTFTVRNWSPSDPVSFTWDGTQDVYGGSKMKQKWLEMGLRDSDWKVYTILDEELKPVQFFNSLVVNILRSYADKECLNLPLSASLCKKLMSMDDGKEVKPDEWDWKTALNFTTDVVFDVDAFRDSMNIENNLGVANVHHEIIARLALNRNGDSGLYLKQYMFFNVKAQQFDYQWGITNTDLCYLMEARNGKELEANTTLAQIRNCFTMLNVDGSTPSNADLVHRFRRHFTPEFYPMRFKLRDPIYEQHPYTLTLLLNNVLTSYSLSRTSYVEFSLSLADLTTPWIYQYLVHKSIWNAVPGPKLNTATRVRKPLEYRFLIGIPRNKVQLPIDGELKEATRDEALTFLIRTPNEAMSHAFNSKAYSRYKPFFKQLESTLNLLNTTAHHNECGLLNTIVGLDFVSEELGYPYCPFIQDKWLDLASKFNLGIRLHCGEGVIRDEKGSIKRAMYAHMYIMALAIRRICARGIKCRIGHGVAFQDCIVGELTEKQKNYERVPSSRSYCIPDGTRSLTPFLALISDLLVEVNITSNSYLVQHAKPSSLIKILNNWLLCTDDDGVWAPPPCAHGHKLQALEYCRAISMGYIDQDDLLKATNWRKFRFNHTPQRFASKLTELNLDVTWSCKYHQPRASSMIALALCKNSKEQLWTAEEKPLETMGLIELLHSFGYYQGFKQFARTIPTPSMTDPKSDSWNHPDDYKIQYFLKLLNPDGTFFGILRSLFLGYDKCLQFIWHENAIAALPEQTKFPMPCLVPGDLKDINNRREQARKIVQICEIALSQIVEQIKLTTTRGCEVEPALPQWIQARLALIGKRGRSEMEYGQPLLKAEDLQVKVQYDTSVFNNWKDKENSNWCTIVKNAEKIDKLEGLIFCDAKFLQPNFHPNVPSSYFNIVWNTQDWYIRPLPQSYFGPYAHVDPADVGQFHTVITRDDRIPTVWYSAALSIAKRLFDPTLTKATRLANKPKDENNPQIIRIAGVGYSGSAIAVLAGMMIATELRYQEVVDKTSASNEVIVWTYGGKQFGSKSFHNKVHNLSDYNLDITRWISLHDVDARENMDDLYVSRYCSQKDILVYQIGPPMVLVIMSWAQRPSWHYFTLMLHHLLPCMQFRNEVEKPNEMSIFFADDKKDLKSLAQSLYFPEYTLICTHEGDATNYNGPLTKHNGGTRTILADDIKIPPYVWKWDPQQHKNWNDIFDQTPVQTTIRFLGDLLLAILQLPENILISLPPHQCDIVQYITMLSDDMKSLNDAKALNMPEKLQKFMDLPHRKDTFEEESCLLLLDLTYVDKTSDNASHISNIRRQLEKEFSSPIKPFRHPESNLITNLEILLVTLRGNKEIRNPFLHYILNQLDTTINELESTVNATSEIKQTNTLKIKDKITELLLLGGPKNQANWPLMTELEYKERKKYIDSYQECLDKESVGSYKHFDLALSLYFLRANTCIFDVTLRRLWNSTDWMSRRIAHKDELWEHRRKRAKEMFAFLNHFKRDKQLECKHASQVQSKEQMSEECDYMYQVEYEKFQFLKNKKSASEVWTSLKQTLHSWLDMTGREHHVMLGDALYRYSEQLWRSFSDEEHLYVSEACQKLIKQLQLVKNDSMAHWVEAFLHYLLGLLTDSNENYLEAINIFSMLWEQHSLQPKDKCWIALHAACCSARVGGYANIACAIHWIGYFFNALEMTQEVERRPTLDWLTRRLEDKNGDLRTEQLRAFIEPWLQQKTSATKS